eukprot:622609-Amphidinium_carterae.1
MELCRSRDHQEVHCLVVESLRGKDGQLELKEQERTEDRQRQRVRSALGPRAGIVLLANSTISRIVLCSCSGKPPKPGKGAGFPPAGSKSKSKDTASKDTLSEQL